MEEEKKMENKKMEEKISETSEKKNETKEEKKVVETTEKKENKIDVKKEESKKAKEEKKETKPLVKKELAMTKGNNLHVSKKHSMYLCSFIKGKKIDVALKDLDAVTKFKIAVPFKGEIPHRKGKGMMSGRYPIKAIGVFEKMLKTLRGNVLVNGLDLEKTVITEAYANWAHRPMRRGSRRAKRTNVVISAKEMEAKK